MRLAKKDQSEQLKEKTRKVKELEGHLELTTQKLQEAERKADE